MSGFITSTLPVVGSSRKTQPKLILSPDKRDYLPVISDKVLNTISRKDPVENYIPELEDLIDKHSFMVQNKKEVLTSDEFNPHVVEEFKDQLKIDERMLSCLKNYRKK